MDQGDQKRQLIDDQTEGTGRLRGGVETAHVAVDRARLAVGRVRPDLDGARDGGGRVRLAIEDAGWFLREHFVWPVEDSLDRLGRRGAIGVFGGGGIAVAGVVAALAIAGSGGSGSIGGTTEAFVTPQRSPAPTPAVVAPAPTPKKKVAKPTGPTLHGAPPDFSAAKDVQAGVGDGKAVGGKQASDGTGGAAAERAGKAASSAGASDATAGATANSNDNAGLDGEDRRDSRGDRLGAGTGRRPGDGQQRRRHRNRNRRERRRVGCRRRERQSADRATGAEGREAGRAALRRGLRRLRGRRNRHESPQGLRPDQHQTAFPVPPPPPAPPARQRQGAAGEGRERGRRAVEGHGLHGQRLPAAGRRDQRAAARNGTGRRQEVASHERPRLS